MRCSVVIPSFNQRRTLETLLRSLEKQTLPFESFEVIVSDDGSSDGTPDFLRSYSGPLKIRCHIAPDNGGRARARNRAMDMATGTHVLFLDGDMKAHPELLWRHLAAQEKEPGTIFIGRVEPVELQQRDPLAWYRIGRGGWKRPPGSLLPPKYFSTNNASLPMELLRKAGPFKESYLTWGGEDLDMGYRLFQAGARMRVLPGALSWHDHPESISEYRAKISHYAVSGLPQLMADQPDHGRQGYLRWFTSIQVGRQLLLSLLFPGPLMAPLGKLACALPSRAAAFVLLDYVTYGTLFHGLRHHGLS